MWSIRPRSPWPDGARNRDGSVLARRTDGRRHRGVGRDRRGHRPGVRPRGCEPGPRPPPQRRCRRTHRGGSIQPGGYRSHLPSRRDGRRRRARQCRPGRRRLRCNPHPAQQCRRQPRVRDYGSRYRILRPGAAGHPGHDDPELHGRRGAALPVPRGQDGGQRDGRSHRQHQLDERDAAARRPSRLRRLQGGGEQLHAVAGLPRGQALHTPDSGQRHRPRLLSQRANARKPVQR